MVVVMRHASAALCLPMKHHRDKRQGRSKACRRGQNIGPLLKGLTQVSNGLCLLVLLSGNGRFPVCILSIKDLK